MPGSNIRELALAGSLKKLMSEKPFGKIGVGGIVRDCGVKMPCCYKLDSGGKASSSKKPWGTAVLKHWPYGSAALFCLSFHPFPIPEKGAQIRITR